MSSTASQIDSIAPQSEATFAETVANLRTILDSAVDGVVVVDVLTGRFVFANPGICQMLGYTSAELNRLEVKDIHPAEALPGVQRHFETILKTGTRTAVDHSVKRKDGSVFPAEIATSLVTVGGRAYAVGFFHDITTRRHADDLLRASEVRFRAIFDSVSDGIVLRDPETGAFIDANPRACEMFGYTREEFLTQNTDRLTFNPLPTLHDAAAKGFAQAVAGIPQHVEWQAVARDGHGFWLDITMRRIAFGDRNLLISTLHDITELKQSAVALNYRDRILHAVTEGTTRLIGGDTLAQGFLDALGIVGEALDVDRVNVISDQPAQASKGVLEGIWERAGIDVSLASIGFGGLPIDPSAIAAWLAPLRTGKHIVAHVENASPLVRGLMEYLRNKSTLYLPIFAAGEFWGTIAIDACRVKREWTPNEIGVLATFAGVIGMAVVKNRAQFSLRRSEERFRAVSESAQDAMIMTGPTGNIQYWNPAAERMFGYTADEARAKGAAVDWLMAPRFREEINGLMVEFATAGRNRWVGKTQEFEALRSDGSALPIEVSLATVVLPTERFMLAIIRDITQRKKAEADLLASEAQLSNALHIARAGHWVYDVVADRFTFNDNFYSIFHTSAAAEGGYTMSSAEYAERFCYPDDRPLVGMAVAAAINSPDPNYNLEIEHRIVYKDGEVGHVAVRFFVVKNAAGKTVRTYGVNQDITARKHNEETLRRVNRTLRTLSSANNVLVHATDEQRLLDEMCRVVIDVGGYAVAWIGRRDENGSLTPIAHAGNTADAFLDGIKVSWTDTEFGRGPAGTASRTKETQINHDFDANPAMAPWRERATAAGFHSSIYMPLKEDRIGNFGVLSIYSTQVDAFDPAEVSLLNEMANDIAFGIAALRDRTGREAALDRLHLSLEATVAALASTSEVRDVYTAGHQRRVSELSTAIARRMGLPASKIQGLRLAGIIHDVGKIQIPAEILSKPGKLSHLEFEMIKEHSQAGYDIVKGIDFPWPIADIILQHQERLDGSGYPHGLKGDEILIEARILSVADVVEAMMSHRPYRPALGLDAALAEIERGRDKLYDAAAVDACIALFREENFTFADTKH